MTRTVRIAAQVRKGAKTTFAERRDVVFSTPLFAVHPTPMCEHLIDHWTVTHKRSGFAVTQNIIGREKAETLCRAVQRIFTDLEIADFTDGHQLKAAAGDQFEALCKQVSSAKLAILGTD